MSQKTGDVKAAKELIRLAHSNAGKLMAGQVSWSV